MKEDNAASLMKEDEASFVKVLLETDALAESEELLICVGVVLCVIYTLDVTPLGMKHAAH